MNATVRCVKFSPQTAEVRNFLHWGFSHKNLNCKWNVRRWGEYWSPQTHLATAYGSWVPPLREASDLLCPGPTSLLSLNATPFAHLHHLPSPCDMWFNYTCFRLGFTSGKKRIEAMLAMCVSLGIYLIYSWEQKGRDCWNEQGKGRGGGLREGEILDVKDRLSPSRICLELFLRGAAFLPGRTDVTSHRRAPRHSAPDAATAPTPRYFLFFTLVIILKYYTSDNALHL